MTLIGLFRRAFGSPAEAPGRQETPRAAAVLELARENAEKSGRPVPTAADVALALLEVKRGCAAEVLKRFGLEAQKIRQTAPAPPDSDSFDRLLSLAREEQRGLQHQYLGTEHLLLALLRVGFNPISQMLTDQGLTVEVMREAILRELDPNYHPDTSGETSQ